MIAAQSHHGSFSGSGGSPAIQRGRAHAEKLAGDVELAAEWQEILPGSRTRKRFPNFFCGAAADPERFVDFIGRVVKLLGPGEYVMVARPRGVRTFWTRRGRLHAFDRAEPPRCGLDDSASELKRRLPNSRCRIRKELIAQATWCTDRDQGSKRVERFTRRPQPPSAEGPNRRIF